MANRLKEDEKNEKIILNLLELPNNQRCINCNNLIQTMFNSEKAFNLFVRTSSLKIQKSLNTPVAIHEEKALRIIWKKKDDF